MTRRKSFAILSLIDEYYGNQDLATGQLLVTFKKRYSSYEIIRHITPMLRKIVFFFLHLLKRAKP